MWGFYGAMLLQVAYAVLVGLLGHLAAVAVVVGYAEGRQVSVDDAFTEAARAWPRAVWATLGGYLRAALLGLFCLLPGLWMAVLMSQVTVAAFVKSEGSPLDDSDTLVRPRFWQVLGYLLLVYGAVLLPATLFGGVFGAAMRVGHQSHALANMVIGLVGEVAMVPTFPCLVASYYGLNALAGQPAPLKAWTTALSSG